MFLFIDLFVYLFIYIMYVCVYIYIYIYTHAYTCVYIYICLDEASELAGEGRPSRMRESARSARHVNILIVLQYTNCTIIYYINVI